jgi:hypothetical protein
VRGAARHAAQRAVVASVAIVALLTLDAALWTFRAAGSSTCCGTPRSRRETTGSRCCVRTSAATGQRTRKNDDPRRIRDEAILRRVASPSFMPRWRTGTG